MSLVAAGITAASAGYTIWQNWKKNKANKGVTRPYDNYLDNLRIKRSQNVHYMETARNVSSLRMPYQNMANQMARTMLNDDAPMSARMQHGRDMTNQFSEMSYNKFNEASLRDTQRRDAIDDKKAEVQFARDSAWEQEQDRVKQANKERIASLWQSGLSLAGGTLGAAGAGGLLGKTIKGIEGWNFDTGFQMGGGAGAVISGAINNDYELTMQGLGSMANTVSRVSALKGNKSFVSAMNENLQDPNLTQEDLIKIQMRFSMWSQGLLKSWGDPIVGSRVVDGSATDGSVPSVPATPTAPTVPTDIVNPNATASTSSIISDSATARDMISRALIKRNEPPELTSDRINELVEYFKSRNFSDSEIGKIIWELQSGTFHSRGR
jgi:hypothetical protein